MKTSDPCRARAGFSMVELLIVALILSLALGTLSLVGRSSERAYQIGTTVAQLEEQSAQAMDRIVAELRPAVLATLTPDPLPGLGASSLQYVHALGFEDGQVVTSPLRQLAIEYAEGEIGDGLDNDGNGLVDECRVVLTEDVGGPSERRLVLTRAVAEMFDGETDNGADDNGDGLIDERGFYVERIGESLRVHLTLQRLDAQKRALSRTARTSTEVRN